MEQSGYHDVQARQRSVYTLYHCIGEFQYNYGAQMQHSVLYSFFFFFFSDDFIHATAKQV